MDLQVCLPWCTALCLYAQSIHNHGLYLLRSPRSKDEEDLDHFPLFQMEWLDASALSLVVLCSSNHGGSWRGVLLITSHVLFTHTLCTQAKRTFVVVVAAGRWWMSFFLVHS